MAQLPVGRNAAGSDQALSVWVMVAEPSDSVCRSVGQRIADGAFDRRCEVSHIAGVERTSFAGKQPHGRLQSGKREIAALPAFERARQREAVGVAHACSPLDRRSAGIAEADQLGRLVKRLSGGVVERCA